MGEHRYVKAVENKKICQFVFSFSVIVALCRAHTATPALRAALHILSTLGLVDH